MLNLKQISLERVIVCTLASLFIMVSCFCWVKIFVSESTEVLASNKTEITLPQAPDNNEVKEDLVIFTNSAMLVFVKHLPFK
ncbi:hypothetical protein [Fulvivirga ligni]|uniref:hypothetical protein n=1 Tax=Fulvivirga ligni TaxID=2904246 RepID=UPI001F471E39|nr:hypothetical protein [Fulvivirga ligni]UII20055.1 hypothetical protein LVD16_19610 [Fulvivirga ligni]